MKTIRAFLRLNRMRRNKQKREEAQYIINVCEKDGKVCLTYKGDPIGPVDMYKEDLSSVLTQLRSFWMAYNS